MQVASCLSMEEQIGRLESEVAEKNTLLSGLTTSK